MLVVFIIHKKMNAGMTYKRKERVRWQERVKKRGTVNVISSFLFGRPDKRRNNLVLRILVVEEKAHQQRNVWIE